MLYILVTVVIGLGQWLIYTALLWGMIKVQRLNYNVLGLFGSSLLATALGYIPVVGAYIGWAALVICLWKCTQADIAPDVLFTVGVAGALMFCVNLFAIGWLMGNLHLVSPALAEFNDADDAIAMEVEADEEETEEPTRVASASARKTTAPVPRVASVTPASSAAPIAGELTVKGISVTAAGTSALIAHGRQIHDVSPGATFTVHSDKGLVQLVCEEITRSSVTLTANGTPVTLRLH